MGDTLPRVITEQDGITVMIMEGSQAQGEGGGAEGRVQQLWVLVKEARRKRILKRPRVCGAPIGADEGRGVTELSLSRRYKWARLQHVLSHLPQGSLREFPSLDSPVLRCMPARTRDSQETCLTSTLMR